ncbi:GNAT family N-acetyltransferase [Taklimakanibacter deserti]|uniref:GNAT family N-acetyltransferase n=1 Tax=Taklimakanibacter deserti TaxID=2267839 RepID=UPI000E652DCD
MNMTASFGTAEAIRVEALTTLAHFEKISPAWQALGERAGMPAGSHLESWLAPVLKHGWARQPAEVVALWRGGTLCGLLALRPGRGPLRRSWTSPLSFLGTPLIDQERPEAILKAFLASLSGKALILSNVPATGPFWDMLGRAVAESQGTLEVLDRWERAILLPKASFDEWFNGNFERKRRKEFRRLRARLGEEGKLESLAWAAGDPLDPWIDELIALEARGWKGRRGTALAADAAMATAFREALHRLAAEGSLRLWKIAFDGKPIAVMSGLVKGNQGWLGKIAYDETFAKYSPGVMLVLDATERLIDKERLALVDSCAIPNHPMINNIWRDRLALCDVMIKGPELSSISFDLLRKAETTRRRLRSSAKALVYRITGRQKS